jgi:transposase InsO family protein
MDQALEPPITGVTSAFAGPQRHLAVVLDVYSRRVVGWSIDASPTGALVTNTLGMAIDSRTPPAGAVIHSDRGTQFGSWAFTERARPPDCCPRWAASRIASTASILWSPPSGV